MEAFLEDPVKGPLAAEARVLIDLRDRLGGITEQIVGVIQTEFIQITVEIGMEDAGEDPGQGIGADVEVSGHGGQGNLFREMRGDVAYRLVGQFIVDDRGFVHQFHFLQASGDNDLQKSLTDHVFICGIGFLRNALDGVEHIRVQVIRLDHGIFRTVFLQGGVVSTGQLGRGDDIQGFARIGFQDLIIMDDIGEDQTEIPFFHMVKIIADPQFQGTVRHIDKFYGFMDMRRDMPGLSVIDLDRGLSVFV